VRQKLNENPVLQAVILGVLAIGVGFMLITRMSGGGGGAQPDAGLPAAQEQQAAGTAVPGTDPAAAAPQTTPAPTEAPPASPAPSGQGGGAGEEFVAGPGLPKEVASAFDDNKAVVLLIVRGNASDDQRVMPMVAALRERDDTAVFLVKAFDIAKYSRIATGVDVDRTPALVVVQPKRLTQGPLPSATVSYGFRGKASVDQAVDDALYEGRQNLPYYPE
jgi:hypothetical protein